MSLTLGEKLRQAREERGISISEVAEQTRISAMYLELIENDDYRTLPGGIFNKGFVKSYAKYVGLDEQEALQDYAQVVAADAAEPEESRTYRPEVLTDDRTSGSMIPTIIFAVIILGLMTWGILALVHYIQENQNRPAVANTNTNTGANVNTVGTNSNTQTASTAPAMGAIKIEFKAVGDAVSISWETDGKRSSGPVTPDKPMVFEPKETFKLSYSKGRVPNAQLTINGKQITLPTVAANPKRPNIIEIQINNDNLAQIWQSGEISFGTETPAEAPTPVAAPASTPSAPKATPKPAVSPSATPARTATPKPTASPKKPNE
jgi:cytoskeletal protein RodZ